ncbi:Fe-S cluster assembly protein SufD [Candidatus Woesearchaeota archaeon]|nr:Fe-S cluster assembly protein SufD [Candidatus Woesearchaeota archaeon]
MLNQNTVRTLSRRQREPSWILQKRLDAFADFKRLAVPNASRGTATQINTRFIDITKVDPLQGLGNITLPTTPEGVIVSSFQKALTNPTTEKIIKQHFWTAASPTQDKFSALHAAFFNEGVLIHVKRNTRIETPFLISCDQATQNKLMHTLIVAEAGSAITIIDQSGGDTLPPTRAVLDAATQAFYSTFVEIIAYEGAQVNYVSVQELPMNARHFATKKAIVGKEASVFWIDCCLGSGFTQATTASTLAAPGSSTKNWGFFFGKEDQYFDLNSVTIHAAPHTASQMLTKGVLDDKAKTSYRGLICIEEGAHHSDGHQKEETLLIGTDAAVDAAPILEIKNDDVKCSHGVTIGQVDTEKLFYMMARGLDEATAKVKIIEGFFEPMIIQIKNDTVCDHIRERIAQRLASFIAQDRTPHYQTRTLLVKPLLD